MSGPRRGEDPERFRETCRWAYRVLAQTARDEGVVLAVEPVRPLSPADDCPVPTIADALALLEDLQGGTAGILVDSWHVAPDPEMREQIVRNRERIVAVHLADQRPGALSPIRPRLSGRGHLRVARARSRS